MIEIKIHNYDYNKGIRSGEWGSIVTVNGVDIGNFLNDPSDAITALLKHLKIEYTIDVTEDYDD